MVLLKVKVRLMYLEALKQEEMFHLHLWSLNNKQKGMNKAFRPYKTNKQAVSVVFTS